MAVCIRVVLCKIGVEESTALTLNGREKRLVCIHTMHSSTYCMHTPEVRKDNATRFQALQALITFIDMGKDGTKIYFSIDSTAEKCDGVHGRVKARNLSVSCNGETNVCSSGDNAVVTGSLDIYSAIDDDAHVFLTGCLRKFGINWYCFDGEIYDAGSVCDWYESSSGLACGSVETGASIYRQIDVPDEIKKVEKYGGGFLDISMKAEIGDKYHCEVKGEGYKMVGAAAFLVGIGGLAMFRRRRRRIVTAGDDKAKAFVELSDAFSTKRQLDVV